MLTASQPHSPKQPPSAQTREQSPSAPLPVTVRDWLVQGLRQHKVCATG